VRIIEIVIHFISLFFQASILSHFKGYNACIDAFIEQIQLQQYRGKDIFKDIVPLCEASWGIIQQVIIEIKNKIMDCIDFEIGID